jgi:hypothetical protein
MGHRLAVCSSIHNGTNVIKHFIIKVGGSMINNV